MIKILYVVSTFKNTGPTNQLFNILSQLDLKRFDFKIITLSEEDSNSLMEKFIALNCSIHQLKLSRVQGLFKASKNVGNIIEAYRPDIIHTQGIRADRLISSIEGDAIQVASLRNLPSFDYPAKFGKVLGRIMAYNHIKAIQSIASPIACSVSLAKEFQEKYGITISAIQNGVNVERYCPIDLSDKVALKSKLGLSLEKKIFITTGSLISRKNVKVLISLFSKLQDDLQLLIVGDGPLLEELKESATKEVVFTGHVSNVLAYLQCSDYYLSASLSEGLPNSVLEAMSVGLPAILSSISSHEELVSDSSNYLFTPDSLEELKAQVTRILKDDYSSLSCQTSEHIRKNFSAQAMSEKYQNLYIELVAHKKTS